MYGKDLLVLGAMILMLMVAGGFCVYGVAGLLLTLNRRKPFDSGDLLNVFIGLAFLAVDVLFFLSRIARPSA